MERKLGLLLERRLVLRRRLGLRRKPELRRKGVVPGHMDEVLGHMDAVLDRMAAVLNMLEVTGRELWPHLVRIRLIDLSRMRPLVLVMDMSRP